MRLCYKNNFEDTDTRSAQDIYTLRNLEDTEDTISDITTSNFLNLRIPDKMPLVVPGVTTNDPAVAKTEEWMNKLCGKTLADHTSETVRTNISPLSWFPRPES